MYSTLHLLFLHQNTLKVRHHPGWDAVEHIVVFLLPLDRFVISWVLNNSRLILFDHTNAVMELFRLCSVEDVQALLTHELVVNIWVLLVQVVGESILTIKVGAGAVRTHKLLVV